MRHTRGSAVLRAPPTFPACSASPKHHQNARCVRPMLAPHTTNVCCFRMPTPETCMGSARCGCAAHVAQGWQLYCMQSCCGVTQNSTSKLLSFHFLVGRLSACEQSATPYGQASAGRSCCSRLCCLAASFCCAATTVTCLLDMFTAMSPAGHQTAV
jgi:hypothetical protein